MGQFVWNHAHDSLTARDWRAWAQMFCDIHAWGLKNKNKSNFVLVPYFHVICLDFVFGLSGCLY